MDLSKIDGLELTDEQRAAIEAQALADLEAETEGLKAKRDELLNEKKEAARKAEEAEQKAREEAVKSARKAGELGELEKNLKAMHAAELAAKDAELAKRDKLILGSRADTVIAELAGEFTAPDVAKRMLAGMVDVSYTDTGTIAMSFKGLDGGAVATDTAGFKEYLRNTEQFAPVLKAIDSSGGGAGGSNSKDSAAGGQGSDFIGATKARLRKKFGKT